MNKDNHAKPTFKLAKDAFHKIALFLCVLSLTFIIAGCGGPNLSQEPNVPSPPAQNNIENGSSPDDKEKVEVPSNQDDQKIDDMEPGKDHHIEKTYQMNKNYIIVPKNAEVTDKKVVLLTFDDGPKEQEMVEGILDILDKHEAKAIFFVNGYRVKAKPELLKLIADRGQIIGNHSWDHIDLKKENSVSIQEQIEKVQTIVEEVTGSKPQFFRPPHGSSNEDVRHIAKEEGLLFMNWSNGSLDWDMGKVAMEDRPAALIQNVMNQLHSGSNILMHELSWTVAALDDLLSQLKEKGYSFVDPRAIEVKDIQ